MDPSLAEFFPPGKLAPAPAVGRHLAYAAVPVVLFAFDVMVATTSRAGGCAAFGEAIDLLVGNIVVILLTGIACIVELVGGHRSGWLGAAALLNSIPVVGFLALLLPWVL